MVDGQGTANVSPGTLTLVAIAASLWIGFSANRDAAARRERSKRAGAVHGDEALFTSGNYARFRQDEQERYPHILDPRNGWPVRDVASATVISGNGALADAAATALIVAGLDEWMAVARSLGLIQVLIIDDAGRVYLTPEMEARVRLDEDVERVVVDWAAERGS